MIKHFRPLTSLGAWMARHLVLMAIVLGLVFDGWLLWESSGLWPDLPLAPERISAKQLRVNETQRTTLLKNMTQYRQITAPSGQPKAIFSSPAGN